MKEKLKHIFHKILHSKLFFFGLILCLLITSCLVFNMSSETAYAATCPGKESQDWQYWYMTGCSVCGGKRSEYTTWDRKTGFDGTRYHGHEDAHENSGNGIIVKDYDEWTTEDGKGETYTDVTVTYRCYNCGYKSYDGKIYKKDTYDCWANVISFTGTNENGDVVKNVQGPQHEDSDVGGKGAGPGAVPWYECGFCGGLSAGSYKHNACQSLTVNVSNKNAGTITLSNGSTGLDRDTETPETVNRFDFQTSESGTEVEVILGPGASIDIEVAVNDGYEFTGWSTGETEKKITYTAPNSNCGSKTITANLKGNTVDVTIQFVDEDGNELADSITKEVDQNKEFTYTADSQITVGEDAYSWVASGWKMGSKTGTSSSTKVTINSCTEDVIINYVYEKEEKSVDVTIQFQSTDGEELASTITKKAAYGEKFTYSAKTSITIGEAEYEFVSADWEMGGESGELDSANIAIENCTEELNIICWYEESICDHVFGEWITVDSGENGTCNRVCELCGYETDPETHDWYLTESETLESDDEGNTTKLQTYECMKSEGGCGDSYQKEVTSHKHNYFQLPYSYDYPMEDGDWEDWYKYNPNEYHWEQCDYESCGKTRRKAIHIDPGEYTDEGDGYLRKRCTVCYWILDEIPITVNIKLNPNGGKFPTDGTTELKEIGPFTYRELTTLNTLPEEYLPVKDGEEFFGYYVVDIGVSEPFYVPNWDTNTLEGTATYFGTYKDGSVYSKIKKAYTIHAQYRTPSYEVEYHPVSSLANPQTMIKSFHDVGVAKKLEPVGFYVTVPITYSTGTEAGTVETTADNTLHSAKFLGWAITEQKAKEMDWKYKDKEEVLDLMKHSGTFHLYASWEYGTIILPNANSANGGMKLSGWTNGAGEFYSVLDSTGNYTNKPYQLSGEPEKFTAVWIPNTYNVSFDTRGGSDCDPIKVTYNKEYGYGNSGLPETIKDGYKFTGWINEVTGETVTEDTIVTIASDHTLIATWEPLPIIITVEYCFDSIGTPRNPQKYASDASDTEKAKLKEVDADTDTYESFYNEYYGNLPEPSMEGFTFVGWYKEKGSDGGGCGHSNCLVSNSLRITESTNHTVYAKWTENEYKVNLDTNQGYTVGE